MRSGLCNCLAIYDWRGDISLVRFHEIAKAMFDATGVLPDTGSITLPGAEKNDIQEYSRVIASLPTLRGSVDFFHTVAGYKQLIFGWDVFASLSTSRDKTLTFCFAQSLTSLGIEYFEGVVRVLAEEVDLQYGIGYQRDFELGPDLYAVGMETGLGYSPRDIAEGDRIAAWMHDRARMKRHLAGYLRDVYPLNILSSLHLAREVEGHSLAQWIEHGRNRGRLIPLSNETWLWKVPEENLADVRIILQQAGCTIVPPVSLKNSIRGQIEKLGQD